ncbi:FxLYD domain-containing protein [Actinoplanes sp. NPDC051470]|uniref:FxLYD domain-containing protein n=1 Tax=Actinoplanes sp. NPDC051470 TaxID=3157224 RepID=UPI00341A2F87
MTAPHVPGQPYNVPPTGYPTPPPAPKPKPTFWQTFPGAMTIVGIVVAGIAVLFLLPMINPGPDGDDLDVNLTSCNASQFGNARVGITVKNNSKQKVTAKIGIEFRDSAGARVDTDTAYVRDIAPGDTARSEELTNLDASSGSITCKLTSASVL